MIPTAFRSLLLLLTIPLRSAFVPNFVVFFLDDHGWGDLGANWPSTHETPNLDKLASNGLRFTDFHSAFSVCTPSRAALLTGRLAPRTGVGSNFGQESKFGLASQEVLLPELLSETHESHMLGKWVPRVAASFRVFCSDKFTCFYHQIS